MVAKFLGKIFSVFITFRYFWSKIFFELVSIFGTGCGTICCVHGSAKATKIESSCLNEIPLQMLPMGMWGPENMKIKKFHWDLFEFYIFIKDKKFV